MFRSFLRWQLFRPIDLGRIVYYLPSFVRVFYGLMRDPRVSVVAKLVPILTIASLFTPPALELDMIPIVGELDWIVVIFLALKIFVWICPDDVVREHVSAVARNS